VIEKILEHMGLEPLPPPKAAARQVVLHHAVCGAAPSGTLS
jgi:hypothetical protein